MATTRCDGIGCERREPAPARDQARDGSGHKGWLELSVDESQHRFCSWDCLATYANNHMLAFAGD
jgi:hypothetical protein